MAFLALHSDDELTPDAAEAAQQFLAEHPGPLSNLDRVLLGSASVFASYRAWFTLRDELIPFLGERAVDLFCFAISDGYVAPYPTTYFRRALEANGDDPVDPHVTEAERLLIDWGRALGAGAASIPPALGDAVEQTFQPRLRLLLTAFAGLMVAVCVVTVVGRIPSDD